MLALEYLVPFGAAMLRYLRSSISIPIVSRTQDLYSVPQNPTQTFPILHCIFIILTAISLSALSSYTSRQRSFLDHSLTKNYTSLLFETAQSELLFFLQLPSTVYYHLYIMCIRRRKNCVCGHVKPGHWRFCSDAGRGANEKKTPCRSAQTNTSGSTGLCGRSSCRITRMNGKWTCCRCRTRNDNQFQCDNDDCGHCFCRNCTGTPQGRRH